MRTLKLNLVVAGVAVTVAVAAPLFAQGPGKAAAVRGGQHGGAAAGLPRSGASRQGLEHSGLNRAGQNVAKPNHGSARNNAARSPSASGLNHALKGKGNTPLAKGAESRPGGIPAENAERIRDQRLNQADHLREVGEANGNERLQGTADRMQASAERQYERRVGTVSGAEATDQGTTLPQDGSTPVANSAAPPISAPPADLRSGETRAATKPAPRGKSSWLPSWLR